MTRNIILIPVQIGLVANFDTVVVFLLMGPKEQKFIRGAAKQIELKQISKFDDEEENEEDIDKERLLHKEMITTISLRLYAYGLATMIIIFALHPEEIFDHVKFLSVFIGNAPLFAPAAPCDKVYTASLFLPLLLSAAVVILRTVFTAYHDKTQKKTVLFFFICLFHIIMTTLFVIYSWVPIALIIFNAQYQTL